MRSNLNRRDFGKLSAAALSGMLAGTVGCNQSGKEKGEDESPAGGDTSVSAFLQEPHVCRGLNSCKGNGSCKTAANACKGKNACAGQGACATAKEHACDGMNACKGQGGCGDTPGENRCDTKGTCSVPLEEKTWAKARANFEAALKKAGKPFGTAPEKS